MIGAAGREPVVGKRSGLRLQPALLHRGERDEDSPFPAVSVGVARGADGVRASGREPAVQDNRRLVALAADERSEPREVAMDQKARQ